MGLPNAYPYEVMGAPHSLYIAAVGTARPDIDAEVDENVWAVVGKQGNRSYAEEGVRVNSPQAFNYFRGYASAAPRKAFRSEEDVMAQVTMADLTLESLALAFNKVSGDVAVVTAKRTLGLSRGLGVATFALLVRGPSMYMDDALSQWWIPAVNNVSSIELAMRRDNATTYPLEFRAIFYDLAADGEEMGVLEAQAS